MLLDPGHIHDAKSELDELLQQGNHPLIVEDEADFDFMFDFVMEQPPFLPWPLTAVSTQKMAERVNENQKIWQDITKNQGYDFKAMLKQIQAPTMIAWGKQDRVLNYKNAYVFQKLIPNAEVHLFENVGHAPMIEVPKQTADLIRNYCN